MEERNEARRGGKKRRMGRHALRKRVDARRCGKQRREGRRSAP